VIERDLENYGKPTALEGSDDRAYRMAAKLGDLVAKGRCLLPLAIATLLHKHWASHFDLVWLLEESRERRRAPAERPGLWHVGYPECDDTAPPIWLPLRGGM
jgi:hypothetical protein